MCQKPSIKCPPPHHQGLVTNRRPDQTERARLGIICMRHTIASRCSKLCFCAIPSDKNHLCNGSLQQSKDVILRGNQNSEYLERMHFVFIIRISIKFIVESIFFANDLDHPPGGTAFPLAIKTYMDHADGRESLFSTFQVVKRIFEMITDLFSSRHFCN